MFSRLNLIRRRDKHLINLRFTGIDSFFIRIEKTLFSLDTTTESRDDFNVNKIRIFSDFNPVDIEQSIRLISNHQINNPGRKSFNSVNVD